LACAIFSGLIIKSTTARASASDAVNGPASLAVWPDNAVHAQ
jgi:hypothetical protein